MPYTAKYTVKTYDTDAHKRMTAPALLRVLNEAAMQHVLALQLSVWDLEPHRISWVLLRLEMHLHRLPDLNEDIQIVTNPSGFERVFTYRDFRVTDAAGNTLAEAMTTWVLFNVDTRRPARIPPWIIERAPIDILPALARPTAKLNAWEGDGVAIESTVGWHDIDFNWHLNNLHYLRLLLDSMPSTILQAHRPEVIKLHYQTEAKLGELLQASSYALGEGHYQHQLTRSSQVIASAESQWTLINQNLK